MTDLCRLIFWTLVDLMRARATLEAEIWVLRQQINVLRRAAPRRQSFGIFDRLILEGCRFGGAWFLFPLPHALPLPPGVNAPSLSNLHAGCRAANHPYPSCFWSALRRIWLVWLCLKGAPG